MPGRSFAEVLDDALGPPGPADNPAAGAASIGFSSPHPLLFFRLEAPVTTTAPAGVARRSRTTSAGDAVHTAMFSADQRRALDLLRALGATLRPDFTGSELRRQYRLLARRLHPDRHPAAAAGERAKLSLAFAAATDSYRLLSAVVTAH